MATPNLTINITEQILTSAMRALINDFHQAMTDEGINPEIIDRIGDRLANKLNTTT